MKNTEKTYTPVTDYGLYSLADLKSRLMAEFEREFDETAAKHSGERMFLSFVTMKFSSLVRQADMGADVSLQLERGMASAGVLEHWARMPSWGQEETASLLSGLDPVATKDSSERIRSVASVNQVARKFVDTLAILVRGGYYKLRPDEVIDWADQFHIEPPAALREAIARMWKRPHENDQNQGGEKRIRGDREQTLLRVIAGLWSLSTLPPEPTTAADKVSALFDGWGWEKPTKATIAEKVLSPAVKLDRVRK